MEPGALVNEVNVIRALRLANKNTIVGNAIHKALDNKETIMAIFLMVLEQLRDDEGNSIKKMPEILGEGYKYLHSIIYK